MALTAPRSIAREARATLARCRARTTATGTAVERPIVVVGCGRSGTTLAGRFLASHPSLAYLHERRDLWGFVRPTDVWSVFAPMRGGRLHLDAGDATEAERAEIRHAFAVELERAGKPRMVEKLPVNAFRLRLVEAVFPEARVVEIVRHPADVARSIAERIEAGEWLGYGDYKWSALELEAERLGRREYFARARTPFERALIEWRLSHEAAAADKARVATPLLTVRYEDLVADPARVWDELVAFADLEADDAARNRAMALIDAEPRGRHPWPGADAESLVADVAAALGYESFAANR